MTSSSVTARLQVTFAALRYENYRRWFIGQVLSLMGTWMQSVAQGWLVYQMTGSKLALGAISAAGTIPTLFFMLPAGVIADRMSKRKLIIATQTAMMIFAFVLALLSWTKLLQVWHIGVLAFLLGVANAFDAPARLALTPELVEDRNDLQNAIALGATMFNLARVVGPAIGGLVLGAFGATWCFVINGLSFVAVIIALLGMHLPNDVGRPPSGRRMTAEIGEGLRYIVAHPIIRMVMLLIAVTSVFAFSYAVLLPAYATDVLKVGEAGYGLMNAAVGIGALAGSLVVASLSRRSAKGKQLTFGSLLFPLALLAFAATQSFPLALAGLVAVGFGFVIQNATCNTLVQSLTPDMLRGRVMSVYTLMFFGATPLGSLFAGGVAQASNSADAIMLGAGITLAFALYLIFFAPYVRKARL
jgi:MFS family permease